MTLFGLEFVLLLDKTGEADFVGPSIDPAATAPEDCSPAAAAPDDVAAAASRLGDDTACADAWRPSLLPVPGLELLLLPPLLIGLGDADLIGCGEAESP